MPFGDRGAYGIVGKGAGVTREHLGGDGLSTCGSVAYVARLHVAVAHEGKRTRDGRGRHGEQITARPFCAQGRPLPHAEAVLLVDDRKRHGGEDNVGLYQGMGAEKNLDAPICQIGQHARALGRRRRAREQRMRDARRVKQPGQRRLVLAGKQLGGRHHRGLVPAAGRAGQRAGRHDRLAASHVAYKHAVHDARCSHVGHDLVHSRLLVVCQLEG